VSAPLNPADYPRTYGTRLAGPVLLVIGVGLALAAVGLIVAAGPNGHPSRSPLSFLWVLACVTLLPCILVLICARRSKLVLSEDAIERHGVFSVRTLARCDIAGRRLVRVRANSITLLVPRGQGVKTWRLSFSSFKTDALLEAWIASLPDLDALDLSAAEAQLEADPQLGSTPEERVARLAVAKKLAQAFNAATLGAAAWGYGYPKPYWAAVLTLALLPWAAVVTVARSDGLYRILTQRNQVRPSLALPMLVPGFVLLVLSLRTGVLDVPRALSCAVVVAVLLAGAGFASDATMREQRGSALLWMLLLLSYGYGSVVLGNRLLEHSPGEDYQVAVLGKRMSHGRSTAYYLMLAPWGPRREPGEVSVSRTLYAAEMPGDSVCVHQGPGALGIGWYVVAPCW